MNLNTKQKLVDKKSIKLADGNTTKGLMAMSKIKGNLSKLKTPKGRIEVGRGVGEWLKEPKKDKPILKISKKNTK
jgi:hypothetical protein